MELPTGQMQYQIVYFNIVIYGAIAGILRNCLSCYFSGIGRTKIVMIANLVAMVVNVVLDYIMIFGKFGFPAMGIRGAACATVIGGVCGTLILFFVYLGKKNRHEFSLAGTFRFDPG